MRRLVVVAGVAAVATGAVAWYRMRRRGPAIPKPATGIFANGMAYARWGTGPRTLLVIPGGPGSVVSSGTFLSMYQRGLAPFVEEGYTAWLVTRKQGMPRGYSIADMADDYGELVADEFGGQVDVVLGISTGGEIGFYLAARHPERFGHIAIALAGCEVSERGKSFELDYARLLQEGRTGEALAAMLGFLYPVGRVPGVARVVGTLMAPSLLRGTYPSFESDTLVEAEADAAFDARAILPDISVPVLLIGAGEDQFFAREVIEETARLIPDCTLKLYEGKGHLQAATDPRLPHDLLDFVRQRPRVQPGEQAPKRVAVTA